MIATLQTLGEIVIIRCWIDYIGNMGYFEGVSNRELGGISFHHYKTSIYFIHTRFRSHHHSPTERRFRPSMFRAFMGYISEIIELVNFFSLQFHIHVFVAHCPAVTILAFAFSTLAHWNYDRLIHNNEIVGKAYTYIRQTTKSNSPVTDVSSNDTLCNIGGENGNPPDTYEVAAGDSVGFVITSEFGHPGPQQVRISKATNTAVEYDGSGDWAKIYSVITSNITSAGLQWSTNGISSFVFDLPTELPAGEYLLRAEGLTLHSASTEEGAQWYIGSAQLKVTGSGSGTMSTMINIPGLYRGTEAEIEINIYYPVRTNYTAPGPAVWPSDTSEVHAVKTISVS